MVDAHLLGIVAFQPCILADFSLNELDGHLTGDLNHILSFLTIIEPGLRPPAYSCIIRIDTGHSGYVETSDINPEILQRVDEAAVVTGFLEHLFFLTFIPRGEKDSVTDGKVVKEIAYDEVLDDTDE
jgi:hypothetical protein